MSDRRWQAGDEFWAGGIRHRVVPGRKGPDDLRLEYQINGNWEPVPMEVAIAHTDFFFENEQALYPRTRGYRGGYEFLRALQNASRYGWLPTIRQLRDQKAQRRHAEVSGCLPTHYLHSRDGE